MNQRLLNFANAKVQDGFELIPNNTAIKARINIKQGYYDDEEKGITGGFASIGNSGAIYLKAEYDILDTKYKGRKIFGLIGLYSPKGDAFKEIGDSFIRALLESANNISKHDLSQKSNIKRTIQSYGDLNDLIFAGIVSITQDHNGQEKNEIRKILTPDDARYDIIMGTKKVEKPKQEPFINDEIPF